MTGIAAGPGSKAGIDEAGRGPFVVAVAVPCWNEAATIGEVVLAFRAALPAAAVHVYDNGSTDGSADIARAAGATVHKVPRRGKGNVVRAILDDLTADAVVIVDGDATYPAEAVHSLLEPIARGDADMVVGERVGSASLDALRRSHRIGNRVIVGIINLMFGTHYSDVLSGYRALGRRFVGSVPVLTPGFEIETELTVRALEEGMTVVEIPIEYRPRPAGSLSKLHAVSDGYRILLTAVVLLRDHYPLRVFGAAGLLLLLAALVGLALRSPAQAGTDLWTSVVLVCAPLGLFSIALGLLLNAITTRSREFAQIARRGRGRG